MTVIPEEGLVDWRPEWDGEDRVRFEEAMARVLADPSPVRVLRAGLNLSQIDLAELLGTTQSAVSKLEAKGDPRISLVRKIVEGRGGRLRMVADFAGVSIDLLPATATSR